MTVRERISIICFSDKINKSPEYAKQLGVFVINKKDDNVIKPIRQSVKDKESNR
ncbi:MAG: hypothetical protein ACLU4K_06535 [Oscillospiraceae bacterium]